MKIGINILERGYYCSFGLLRVFKFVQARDIQKNRYRFIYGFKTYEKSGVRDQADGLFLLGFKIYLV